MEELYCSFCGSPQLQVDHLIRGNHNTCICDACVTVCVDVIEEKKVAKPKKSSKPYIKPKLTPKDIVDHLNQYVIGQDRAKKLLAVAVYNHYKRIGKKIDVDIQKSNVMLCGPSGTGKTFLVSTLAKLFDVPYVVADATTLTEAGYVGDDVDQILGRLIVAAGGDVQKAEKGIVYLDECFPDGVEVLTHQGWINFEKINDSYLIAQWNNDRSIDFVVPERIIHRFYEGDLIKLKSGFGEHISTPNHNRIVMNSKTGNLRKLPVMNSLSAADCVPVNGEHDGPGVELSDDELRFIVAFLADGCVKNKIYGYISLKKQRKINRLNDILGNLAIKHNISNNDNRSYINYYFGNEIEKYFRKNNDGKIEKKFNKAWLTQLSLYQRQLVMEEIKFWDGYQTKDNCYQFFSSDKNEADFISALATTSGLYAYIHARKKEGYRDNYAVTITPTKTKSQQRILTEILPYKGNVHCVTVSTGMILIRQNGRVQVSGNCDKISRSDSSGRDVRGEGVQQSLLKMVEGTIMQVNPKGEKKNPQGPLAEINTKNILFIAGGAFSGLTDQVNKVKKTLGLHHSIEHEENKLVIAKDLIRYGLIPEFIGRFPVIAQLNALNEQDLVKILTEPKNSLIRQYESLFEMDGVQVEFKDDFLLKIARKANLEGTGARGLRAILENMLMDLMYRTPHEKPEKIVIDETFFQDDSVKHDTKKSAFGLR